MFDGSSRGHIHRVPGIPQKRQSVRPNRSVLVFALIAAAALAAVWFAVGAAVGNGGEDCPARQNATTERCR